MIEGLNLLDGRWYAEDAHAIWDEFRRTSPVHFDPVGQVWGIFKHADALAVEKDPKTFSSFRAQVAARRASPDDDLHGRSRAPAPAVARHAWLHASAGRRPRALRAGARREIINRSEKGQLRLRLGISPAPLPLYVIADLLGYEPDMYDDLLRWSEAMMSPNAEDMLTPEQIADRIAKSSTTMDEFRAAQLEIIADRRQHPRDDVMTVLCQAEIDGERLDDESIVQEMLLILIGGDETTRHVLSGGMLELIKHRDQLDALRSGDAELALAAEEMIRWNSPVQNMGRTAT